MRIEVRVPQLPESVAEATLVNWHKQVGEPVTRDENLVDVETDKVVLELPAPDSGVLVEIRQGDGATVAGQQIIAVIDSAAVAAQVKVASLAGAGKSGGLIPSPAPDHAIALPAARKMMSEKGIEAAGSE